MSDKIDISKFDRDPSFYGEIPLLLTIKNFDLAAIRARYIRSRDNVSGRSGSVERREAGMGGLATLTLKQGGIIDSEVLVRLKEPRGIDTRDDKFAFSSEALVYVVANDVVEVIEDEWFSYIHTVNFSPWDASKILVSSSGFDCLFEFDLHDKSKSFEWFAWEHGFSEGIDSTTGNAFQLTRSKEAADQYALRGIEHLLIDDPAGVSLPTAHRAAFINSVFYDELNQGKILATFFHEGSMYRIERESGEAIVQIGGLSKPHGGRNYGDSYLVTSTGDGEVVVGRNGDVRTYSLAGLKGKPVELGEMEWVQNTVAVGDLLVVIDSNRTAFVIIDPQNELYDVVCYDDNWAVQDAVVGSLSEAKKDLIRAID